LLEDKIYGNTTDRNDKVIFVRAFGLGGECGMPAHGRRKGLCAAADRQD